MKTPTATVTMTATALPAEVLGTVTAALETLGDGEQVRITLENGERHTGMTHNMHGCGGILRIGELNSPAIMRQRDRRTKELTGAFVLSWLGRKDKRIVKIERV